MPSHLLTGTPGNLAVLASIAAGTTALASVLRTLIEQASRTRRLSKALKGSRPNQRPEILRACSQLEGTPDGKSGTGAGDRPLPANGRPGRPG